MSDGSTLVESDFIYDSSNMRRYRATCNGCGADRGYVRKNTRHKMCMSCGQTGKVSGRKGKTLSAESRQKISNSNLERNLKINPNYKRRTDEQKRLVHSMRSRVSRLIVEKNSKTLEMLGCSWEEFYKYIEDKFTPNMTWDNYGRKGWHLDHKIPLSHFDLTDPQQLAKACHYSNLQPLWWTDNLKKSNKIIEES